MAWRPETKTSVIAAIVTGILTGLVTAVGITYRLPQEHAYWIEKQGHLLELKRYDSQLKLIGELTEQFSALQSIRWQLNSHHIHYLALEMLAERYGSSYGKALRKEKEHRLDSLIVKFEGRVSAIQGRLMMARLIFENLQSPPKQGESDSLNDFGTFMPSAEFAITTAHTSQIKADLAALPELDGEPDADDVAGLIESFATKINTPGHEKFTLLANAILRHLGQEIISTNQ